MNARKPRASAEVLASAEREVPVVFAVNVKDIRILESPCIGDGRRPNQGKLSSCRNRDALEVDVFEGR